MSGGDRKGKFPYRRHVLVCVGPHCGDERGSGAIRDLLKKEVKSRPELADCRVTRVLCFGLCEHGPNIVIYPEETVYSHASAGDVPAIVEEHLLRGKVLHHLLLDREEGEGR